MNLFPTVPAIGNASRFTVQQGVNPMPQMRSTINGWFKPLDLVKVTKTTVDFQTKNVETPLPARGTWQPFSTEQLKIKPEGQRSWRWFMMHTTTDVVLLTDDLVKKESTKYVVMEKGNYDENGFVVYHLVNAYDKNGGGQTT